MQKGVYGGSGDLITRKHPKMWRGEKPLILPVRNLGLGTSDPRLVSSHMGLDTASVWSLGTLIRDLSLTSQSVPAYFNYYSTRS